MTNRHPRALGVVAAGLTMATLISGCNSLKKPDSDLRGPDDPTSRLIERTAEELTDLDTGSVEYYRTFDSRRMYHRRLMQSDKRFR